MSEDIMTQAEANAAGIATDDLIPAADTVAAFDSRYLTVDPQTYGEGEVRALAEIDAQLAMKDGNGGDWYTGRARAKLERQRVNLSAYVAKIMADRTKAAEVQAERGEPAPLFNQR